MKKKTETIQSNGHSRLEEAIAILSQIQATFVQSQAAFLARALETDRVTSERFARIEAGLATILRVLAEHGRTLHALPEAVRDKIGFKTQP